MPWYRIMWIVGFVGLVIMSIRTLAALTDTERGKK